MSEAFWLVKILALLQNLSLSELPRHTGPEAQKFWTALHLLKQDNIPEHLAELAAKADKIAHASDRTLFNSVQFQPNSPQLTVSHLLSGKELQLSSDWSPYNTLVRQPPFNKGQEWRGEPSLEQEETIDLQQLFWWLWRCLPEAVCQHHNDSLMLLPASSTLPDASIWSHASLSAALAGALAGYGRPLAQIDEDSSHHPYLAIFSFTPVQELIKASRKMRDFWAGSWVLHYLSAVICWTLAQKYGPDSLIYPSLYQQPLIDHWLLDQWPEFKHWITPNSSSSPQKLLTAGFPNVIVVVLPEGEVKAAMQTARQTLQAEWLRLGKLVFDKLESRQWTRLVDREINQELKAESRTWNGWLRAQWQPYWTALPLGQEGQDPIYTASANPDTFKTWLDSHNKRCNIKGEDELFHQLEEEFLQAVNQHTQDGSVNVGSWWPYVFDELRFALSGVKNARTWNIPTAFGPRSTISGIGPVVYPSANEGIGKGNNNHRPITEQDTKEFWKEHAGIFDGIEELNATETLKRGLHLVLPEVLFPNQSDQARSLPNFYPDLSSGVAGWLRQMQQLENQTAIDYFENACADISDEFSWTKKSSESAANQPWGIPWIAKHHSKLPNPRLLNAGWLIDDFELEALNPDPGKLFTKLQQQKAKQDELKAKQEELIRLRDYIAQTFPPGNNPTDWYVLAVGDGDGMSQWLKGLPLKPYQDYMPSVSQISSLPVQNAFEKLIGLKKRMGPSTHNALSRALLDFSNQLLPYLTEQRYAGRLIYGGGDDVLAYTNLWEWDSWLWDVRQCFRGVEDPKGEFKDEGDYWQWKAGVLSEDLPRRPLFTMGREATISFGIVIAHHSVPLAIALENLWAAEKEGAKEHYCPDIDHPKKNALQVRVLYGNGNILKSTAKFDVFDKWRSLLHTPVEPQQQASLPALFEQAAQIWSQHPAPERGAILPWTRAFGDRRNIFKNNEANKQEFQRRLTEFLDKLTSMTELKDGDREVQNWLKLAAFVLRNRQIDIKSEAKS